ncbi:MAG TPA: hypothetical protein ENH20_00990 [Candidatus Pacearchaeota archaeon]|nr:hypothetical protein [Candidatus Pacearchaeota archaeon]
MVVFKHYEIELLKVGSILKHVTKASGKLYIKAKLYLSGDSYVGKNYELYDVGEVVIKEMMGESRGKGLLLFMPEKKRGKDVIGFGG